MDHDNSFRRSSSAKAFVCVSGKRKSGKDFVTRKLVSGIAERCPDFAISICTLSDSLKDEFASLRGVEAAQLKGDGPGKEYVRKEMIAFGEGLRSKDSAYFCRKAFSQRLTVHGTANGASDEVVVVSDCRRPTDIAFFQCLSPAGAVICLRVQCSLATRQRRGFVFKNGVDDTDSECALDAANWDFVVENEEGCARRSLQEQLEDVVTELERRMAPT
uniref:Phosphomevalonate kinase n=1 Tax=Globodera rostochiensis TaxID=31243 RepID=A0A914HGX2_GLORO